jgi:hypothetical protein
MPQICLHFPNFNARTANSSYITSMAEGIFIFNFKSAANETTLSHSPRSQHSTKNMAPQQATARSESLQTVNTSLNHVQENDTREIQRRNTNVAPSATRVPRTELPTSSREATTADVTFSESLQPVRYLLLSLKHDFSKHA